MARVEETEEFHVLLPATLFERKISASILKLKSNLQIF